MAGRAETARQNGRKGGRPKGSTNVPRFADYVSEDDRKTFVDFVLSTYMENPILTKWVGEQLFRKPPQDIGDGEGGALLIQFDRAFAPAAKGNRKQ